MNRWVALFRGINVGGKNLLPMATLRRYLEAIQLTNIKSYIQSGNVVFDSKSKSSKSNQLPQKQKKPSPQRSDEGLKVIERNSIASYFKSTLARTGGTHSGRILHQPCYVKQRDEE